MKFTSTDFKGLYIIEPTIFKDPRGYFYESYNKKEFEKVGIHTEFVQDNRSRSVYGTLRGLHLQKNPFAQGKLVGVLEGKVLDVAVDIRKESITYGKHIAVELSAENKKLMFIPRGFAHGFVVLSKEAEFFYKCDNFYSKEHEVGIIYNDPSLAIDWKINPKEMILSDKDKSLPFFKNIPALF